MKTFKSPKHQKLHSSKSNLITEDQNLTEISESTSNIGTPKGSVDGKKKIKFKDGKLLRSGTFDHSIVKKDFDDYD